MAEIPFLSYLHNIDWSVVIYWYFMSLNIDHLMQIWGHGGSFGREEWLGVATLVGSLLALVPLVAFLFKKSPQKRMFSSMA